MKRGGDAASTQLTGMMGDTQGYYIRGENYRTEMNGTFMSLQVYSPSEQRLYTKLTNVDTLYWNDVTIQNDPVVDWNVSKEQEDVMGVKCSIVVVHTKSGTIYTFYYNSKYAVDPTLYKNHNLGNWNFVIDKTKSLPLKAILDTPQFMMTMTATEVNVKKLDDAIFAVPKDLPKKISRF